MHVVMGVDKGLRLGDRHLSPIFVSKNVWRPTTEHAENSVSEAIGHGTQGLFVVMAFRGHESPIDFCQFGIDSAGGVGGKHQCTLHTVIAALCDLLSRPFNAAAVGPFGKRPQKPRM